MSNLTAFIVVAGLAYGLYQYMGPPPAAAIVKGEDVLVQNPTIVPTGTISQMVSNPDFALEQAATLARQRREMESGMIRDRNGKIAGGQFW